MRAQQSFLESATIIFNQTQNPPYEMILRKHKIPFHLHLLYQVRRLFRREHTFVGRQRMLILLSATLMAFLGVAANLFKLNNQEEQTFLILHYIYLPLTMGAVLLYFLRKVKVKTAIIAQHFDDGGGGQKEQHDIGRLCHITQENVFGDEHLDGIDGDGV